MEEKCILGRKLKVNGLLLLFVILAFCFLYFQPGRLIYFILLLCSIGWLAVELRCESPGKNLKNAFLIGMFLMVFDFAVENSGGFMGYWKTYQSVFPIYFVPLEIMFICVIGGMAWALYLPEKFSLGYSLFDIVFFSAFGAFGEALLIGNGLMMYTGGWTSVHAFFGYLVTWVILHFVRYKVLKV
ncbi:MAG: hypothetical protein V1703_01815 [Candidatus Altiarchaeota archaeon]